MLSRRTTVASATIIAVIAIPVVWSVGYHDHPWRQPPLAIATGFLLIGAGVAAHKAGADEDPPVSLALTRTAIVISVSALLSVLLWAWIGSATLG